MTGLKRSNPAGTVFLTIAAALSLMPLLLVLMNAFKPHAAIVRDPLAWPVSPDPQNFVHAWVGGEFGTGLLNSMAITGITILVTLGLAAPAAFPLARRRIALWRPITIYFLCSVTVPLQLFLFPLYFIAARLGLIGNVAATALILAAINLPLAVLLLRNYVQDIPVELDDAALMDGASPWQIFRHIILPLMRPGLVTVALLVGLNAWNEFLITSTFQQGQNAFTLTLAYRAMTGTITTDRGIMMAGAVILVLPVIVFFLLLQRLFIAGLTAGAVKG
jgi:raffinose/stachyose/melibiose transport system permease protein